jgi:hypothetical protein
MRSYHESGNVRIYFTTIVVDNHAARRLLEARLGDMPCYQPLEAMVTFIIPAKAGASGRQLSRKVDAANDSHLDSIVKMLSDHGPRYQFHPVWGENTMRSADRCRGLSPQDFFVCRDRDRSTGCLALWDQRSFKQTVIRGYAGRLGAIRPFFNIVTPLIGRPRLPVPGTRLETAFLSHVVGDPDDEETLTALIRHACRQALHRGLDYVMIAFAERNPLSAIISRRFRCHSYVSMIYLVYWDDGASEAARLDGRIPHPEMAIL